MTKRNLLFWPISPEAALRLEEARAELAQTKLELGRLRARLDQIEEENARLLRESRDKERPLRD